MREYIWVGLDVHVESITAAIQEGESREAEAVKLSGGQGPGAPGAPQPA